MLQHVLGIDREMTCSLGRYLCEGFEASNIVGFIVYISCFARKLQVDTHVRKRYLNHVHLLFKLHKYIVNVMFISSIHGHVSTVNGTQSVLTFVKY